MKNNIAVLMSTYNGEKYLKAQLDSIFNQTSQNIVLFIRDDGSCDSTLEIIKSYNNKIVLLENNENLGVGSSFMETLYKAGLDFDYYAFCDQDDIWLVNKIEKAVLELEKFPLPTLYCSNQTLVDKELNNLGLRHKKTIDTSYLQILTSNQITGCTMVWNNQLQKLLVSKDRRPSKELLEVRIHDVWVSMVASIAGSIVYDSNSYILYRQHENNVVGVKKRNLILNWVQKLGDSSKRKGRSRLATEILNNYRQFINDDIAAELELLSTYQNSFRKKILLLQNKKIFSLTTEPKWSVFVKILFNLI
ncbi:putative glycosyltransferase EpsE [Streptococcus intermedius]|jgi:rhamnosyltransferase|uniref:Glycosyltransferase EpsE n=1 Tax=Streptococcus intermedius TaxID=1338 RepID=A0AAE8KAW2_STRIT|nr:glycosyltransferase family 2 protein [Streptococcus intermedius]RKW03883.1 MAG: glycosyltransferase [Streptococcus sp.]RSJ12074.1 putative glycosyltransferase EpsE [Streptococcus intermedius]RSJ21908.1 putative glycosyltransferase EpsE [Streptococcus intermedius]RSJ26051.1 putative glycosyltransferase EpsE [Streptococcus intermedius]